MIASFYHQNLFEIPFLERKFCYYGFYKDELSTIPEP